ncbi:hypothetical protein KPATCC21470_0254 [Kitasatospora purpeofusca]
MRVRPRFRPDAVARDRAFGPADPPRSTSLHPAAPRPARRAPAPPFPGLPRLPPELP